MSFETDSTITDEAARQSFLADILVEQGVGAALMWYNRCRRHDPTPLGVIVDLSGSQSISLVGLVVSDSGANSGFGG